MTPIPAGEEHPDVLDHALIDALNNSVLKTLESEKKQAYAASLAFLYIYMKLAKPDARYVVSVYFLAAAECPTDPPWISRPEPVFPLGLGLALLLRSRHARHLHCYSSMVGSHPQYPLMLRPVMYTFLIKAGGLYLLLWPKKSINGLSSLKRSSMGIQAAWTTASLCSVGHWRIPEPDLVENLVWSPFRGQCPYCLFVADK